MEPLSYQFKKEVELLFQLRRKRHSCPQVTSSPKDGLKLFSLPLPEKRCFFATSLEAWPGTDLLEIRPGCNYDCDDFESTDANALPLLVLTM